MFICLGSAKGSNFDMRGSMLFPSERANVPYTAQKSVYLLWPGLDSGEKSLLETLNMSGNEILEKLLRALLKIPIWGGLCGV